MSETTFWIDPLTDHRISYKDLGNRCFRFPLEVGKHNSTDLSEFFLELLSAIFRNASISLNRQGDRFEIDVQVNGKERAADVGAKRLNAENWADKILSSGCRIGISTSGSSGSPNRIVHRMSTLTREIKHHAKHAKDVWGFAYCPTHFAGMQVFLQAVVKRNSIVRLNDYKGLAMYAATKGAIEAFSKSVAREWGSQGIRSNFVVPGFMETDMSADLSSDDEAKVYRRTSLGKPVDIESVASTVGFLLSPASQSVTGQNFIADAGTL